MVIIVSLIDIFAILLIFVIVTTTFKRSQPAVVIKLPESSTSSANPQAEDPRLVELSVSDDGKIRLSNSPAEEVPINDLPGKLKSIVSNHQPLALKADTKAPFGVVIRVMDSLKEAGVKNNVSAFTETIKKGS